MPDIVLSNAQRFSDKLEDIDLSNYKCLFCVGDLEETHIFSVIMRPLKIIDSVARELRIEILDEKTLNEKLKNYSIYVIRREEKNGIKVDNKYCIFPTKITKLDNIHTYNMSNIYIINKYGQEEAIRPCRIFISTDKDL